MRLARLRRVMWGALGWLVLITLGLGGVSSAFPETTARPLPTLWDAVRPNAGRFPVPSSGANLAPGGWSFSERAERHSYGAIDLMGCGDARKYFALGGLPVVVDGYSGDGGFLSVWHVDYGAVAEANRRLRPIQNPLGHCFGRRAESRLAEFVPHVAPDGAQTVIYRSGESLRAVV